jgi:cytochrome c553
MHRKKAWLVPVPLALFALSVALATAAQAPVDGASQAAVIKLVTSTCGTCHGLEGRGDNPRIPRLAGQQRVYLALQLKAFRAQTRSDPAAHEYMWAVASELSDNTIAGLAAYYSEQAPGVSTDTIDAKTAARGKQLFEQGSPERGAPPCQGCHGLNAEGQDVFPRLAGQHREYLYIQLMLIQNQLRGSPVMHGLITQLQNDELSAVASYLQSR